MTAGEGNAESVGYTKDRSGQHLDLADAKRRVLRAIHLLLEKDVYLLSCDVNERSITHKLAEYLQPEFPDWNVDCEYNRNHDDPKRLQLPSLDDVGSDDLNAKTVFPDIIIHQRDSDDNLVVIEVKKSTNPESNERDMAKLAAFKNQLKYRLAMFVEFHTGEFEVGFDHRVL